MLDECFAVVDFDNVRYLLGLNLAQVDKNRQETNYKQHSVERVSQEVSAKP